MEIKGFVEVSLVDWDGKISSVLFLPGCNMRCPFCFNTALVLHPERMPTIPFQRVVNRLRKIGGWIEGVVITGGEPTIHEDLSSLCKKVKSLGLLVKVDTNGTNPDAIERLMDRGLVDCIAMDVKAPPTKKKYLQASGVDPSPVLEKLKQTVNTLITGRIEYEFRTTLVPTLHTKRDVERICHMIKGCRKYALQNFRVAPETLNPKFQNLRPFSETEMQKLLKTAKKYIPNTIIRG